jgi:hypothetical protein
VTTPTEQRLPVEPGAPPRRRAIGALLLLAIGVIGVFILFGKNGSAFLTLGVWGPSALLLLVVIAAAIAIVPITAGPVDRLLTQLRSPSIQSRRTSALTAAVLTAAFLLQSAMAEHRQLWPYVHDEFSYLIQARQFASGHLWMPAHPLAAFFDSFQLFVSPVYASAYFPGTALLYVPGIWLHLPPWITSLTLASVVGGLLYRITTELIDGVAGWLAVLLLWSDRVFRSLSVMTMAQTPLLLFCLLAICCWLKWIQHRQRRWAIGIGFFLGMAAVTRPVDSLCFAIPIGAALLWDVVCRWRARRNAREVDPADSPHGPAARVTNRFLVAVVCIIIGALPSLILQLVLDHGITGHLLETPFRLYADRDYPGTAYGFHVFIAEAHPASDLPQKLAIYREYQPMIRRHQPWATLRETLRYRLPLTLTQGTPAPFPLLLPLLPLAMCGLTRRRAVLLASLPLFLLLYGGYVFFFSHYVLTASAAVIVGIVAGADRLPSVFHRQRRFHAVFLPLLITAVSLAALPQWNAGASDDLFAAPLIADVNHQLAALPQLPAIVLFTYDPARNTNEEPVFNTAAAWPDDSPVIRAHDRGLLNARLFRYYAARQPSRIVYRYDERTRTMSELGTVAALAKARR